jgi:hypothetical protein
MYPTASGTASGNHSDRFSHSAPVPALGALRLLPLQCMLLAVPRRPRVRAVRILCQLGLVRKCPSASLHFGSWSCLCSPRHFPFVWARAPHSAARSTVAQTGAQKASFSPKQIYRLQLFPHIIHAVLCCTSPIYSTVGGMAQRDRVSQGPFGIDGCPYCVEGGGTLDIGKSKSYSGASTCGLLFSMKTSRRFFHKRSICSSGFTPDPHRELLVKSLTSIHASHFPNDN